MNQDPTGAVVPNAKMHMINGETGLLLHMITDGQETDVIDIHER